MAIPTILFIFSAVIAVTISADEIDIGLQNKELVAATVKCLQDKGPCTKFGTKIKEGLKDIAATGKCSKCSKEEENRSYELIKRFRTMYKDEYKSLLAFYRPDGVPEIVPAPLKFLAGDHPSKPLKS